MSASFAVVVVAYQSAASIAATVAAARALPGCTRVVVVDNGTDAAGDAAAAAGATVRWRPDNPGFGASQNEGVACVDEPYVLLLNPDARVHPDGVAAGVEVLASTPAIGAVQGVIRQRRSGSPERSAGDELRAVHLVGRAVGASRLLGTGLGRSLARSVGLADHADRIPDAPREVEQLAATALLVRRTAFESVGGFAPHYFLYGEDLDLCRRLRGRGWRLLALPVEWADHVGGGTASSTWDRELHWWRGTLGFAARWWPARSWRVARAAACVRWVRLALVRPRGALPAWRALIADPRRDRHRRAPAPYADRRSSTTSGRERWTATHEGPTQSSSVHR